MLLGSQVPNLRTVARTDVHQIGVSPVGQLGLGPNELVTVVDEEP
jgi:hypothetical protein